MSMTIHVDETLAARLNEKASSRHLSPQELAVQLLGEAVVQLDRSDEWKQLNDRRLALIHKRRSAALSPQETAELDRLQSETAKFMEPFDNMLSERLDRMEQAAEGLRKLPPSPE